MSNSCLFMKSGFVRAPMHNGIGRYVCQLQRVVLKFCKSHGASRGIRDFIEKNLIDFSKQNTNIAVYVKPRRHRAPILRAEYLNGDVQIINCSNKTNEEIIKWLTMLKTQQGFQENFRLRKLWHTETPSIQGPWNPDTFRDPYDNLRTFPSDEYTKPLHVEKTATEILLELYANNNQNRADAAAADASS